MTTDRSRHDKDNREDKNARPESNREEIAPGVFWSDENNKPDLSDGFMDMAQYLAKHNEEDESREHDYHQILVAEHESDEEWREYLAWNGENLDPYKEYRILRASKALSSIEAPLCRHQELSSECFMRSDDNTESPRVILFVSHRWETPTHPDPTGRQWTAVQILLRAVHTLAQASRHDDDSLRLSLVPTLLSQQYILAARLLGLLSFRGKGILDQWSCSSPAEFANQVLEHVGIFYDYLCLPQKPRTALQDADFALMLQKMQGLVSRVVVLSLRSVGDDYHERAWCVFEASRPMGSSTMLMNMDEPTHQVSLEDLNMDVEGDGDWVLEGRRRLVHRIERWGEHVGRDDSSDNWYGIQGRTWDFFGDIEECWSCLHPPLRNGLAQLTRPYSNDALSNAREVLAKLVDEQLEGTLRLLYDANKHVTWEDFMAECNAEICFERWLKEACRECKLGVTNKKDILFVGFMICASSASQYTSLWGRLSMLSLQSVSLRLPVKSLFPSLPSPSQRASS